MFLSSLVSPPALAFFETIRDEFKDICPVAVEYIDRTNTSNGVTDLSNFFAREGTSDGSSTSTATTGRGKSGRSPMECFLATRARAARSQEQDNGSRLGMDLGFTDKQEWREWHEGRTYDDPYMAFHQIVQRRLTKPGPHELKVWTSNMFMGKPNDLDQDVPANENPAAYGQRVVATYSTLTQGGAEAFRERASSYAPIDVFLNGLPKSFPRMKSLLDKLYDIDATKVNEFSRVAMISDAAQIIWNNSADNRHDRSRTTSEQDESTDRLGKDEYIRLGKPNKHCVSLTPNNIIDKAHMFCSMKLRGVYAPEFDKVIGLMLSTRKYILGQEFARPNAHLDIAQTALVWKARTNLPAFTGGDLGQALYGNPWRSYRYYNDENPDIMRVPMVERDDFYDCVEDFPAGAEAEDEFLTPEDANAQHDSFQDARGDEEEGEDIGTEDSPRSVEEEGEADDGWEDDEGVMLVADAALPPVTPGGWRATRD